MERVCVFWSFSLRAKMYVCGYMMMQSRTQSLCGQSEHAVDKNKLSAGTF